ncbi:hypothetical protein F511_34853 [Dorcoceras hygrometricum]|uniref:Uncharacterized protein n=1 Tax=Dorcoceras hygrometricum TaxID=472368 RepID=A0A2Z7CAN3_9LAMI|nr:hypothetical protein F511_34853 [Dorcoceras hygrometricum]
MFTLSCADVEFLVKIREVVVEEIASFFYSFSLRSLSALTSVSDLAEKEEQVLKWAETDSSQTEVRRRLYITAKYREMLLRKFLEARHNNFESCTPISAIDLQVLDLLSEAHSISLINLLEQLKQHRLEWTRPSSSKLFGGADVYSGGIHSHFYSNVTSTSWEGLNTLRQLSDIIAYINRGRDDKMVVEVHSLKIEADLVVVEEAAMNLRGKEEDLIESDYDSDNEREKGIYSKWRKIVKLIYSKQLRADFRYQLQILSAIGPDDSTIKIKSDKACKTIWIKESQVQSYFEYTVQDAELVQPMFTYFGYKVKQALTTADKPQLNINGAINARYDDFK